MALSLMEKMDLSDELMELVEEIPAITDPLEQIEKSDRLLEVIALLEGADAEAEPKAAPAQTGEAKGAGAASLPEGAKPRVSTAHFYAVRKKGGPSRQRLNDAACDLMERLEAEGRAPTDEEKKILAQYTGNGGGLIGRDGKKGSAYEYYTPMPIAEGIWDALRELGFNGGKVLDPCAGTGIFGASAPLNAAVDAVELSGESGRVNQLINNGPGYNCTISPFERVASKTPDNIYDAVVTNVPFGEVSARGGNKNYDSRYQDEPLENYFILRSLEKLRPGGLAAFITPPRCVSGKDGKSEDLRLRASYMAEFLGAYRLPSGTFSNADTDTVTDVIFFRKFSAEMAEKIEELQEQDPETLRVSNVLWTPFLEGKWFDTPAGHPYMLGTFVAKDPEKFRDVDKVVSNASLADLKEILRTKRLPKSRIDWNMLNAAETVPIGYNDGDHITQAGVTLEMRDGVWHELPKTAADMSTDELLGKIYSPYEAWENGVTYAQFANCLTEIRGRSRAIDIPDWAMRVDSELAKYSGNQETAFRKAILALGVDQIREERQGEQGVNYLEEYPKFSADLKKAKLRDSDRAQMNKLGGYISTAIATARTYLDPKDKSGFGKVWRGAVSSDGAIGGVVHEPETPQEKVAALRYGKKTKWLSIEDVKGALGDDFDPMTDANWCISSDGKSCIPANDYYVGSYQAFVKSIDAQIEAASDETVRAKLSRQKLEALSRLNIPDVSKISFNLQSPFVTVEEKVAFLKSIGYPAKVETDDRTGRTYADVVIRNPRDNREKIANRIGDYMKNGTVTLGGVKLDDDMSNEVALDELRRKISEANVQFNVWCKANPAIMERLERSANNPDNLRFVSAEDEEDMRIPGLNPEFHLHGYQSSFVRKMGRDFSGINGFGVGLGKTFTALAAVQHVQALGVKKKTLFVVPNAVLSNWRKEAARCYTDTSGCLYIGLREKNGKGVVNTKFFDADLRRIEENAHSKIFMTMEAFERLKLRKETIEDYGEHLRETDKSFALSQDKKEDEAAAGRVSDLVKILEKKNAAPYLEDLGIDSLVIDEAHFYKNSSETVFFKGAKYLSLAPASKRGMDAQAKAWYIRGQSELGDGVLLLTATPITNSPLEMYSMMSLAVGRERVNQACLGIQGSDDFMDAFCTKDEKDAELVDGTAKVRSVFVGLQNAVMLRAALADVATIKTAADVGSKVVIPDREEVSNNVQLSDVARERLALYKSAYRYVADAIAEARKSGQKFEHLKPGVKSTGSYSDAVEVMEKFGEEAELIGHPFNLINKMTSLIMDPDLDDRATFYFVPADQASLAQKVIADFNAKKVTEQRERNSPYTLPENITIKEIKRGEEIITKLTVKIAASIIDDGRIVLDSLDYETQQTFEEMAEKAGLALDVSIPPKIAALIENIKKELAMPRGLISKTPPVKATVVKQIVFCDILAMHSKIKRLIAQKCGIPAGKIVVVTGQTNNSPDEILDVQEGFNAHEGDNRYQLIIANEKAEVGINLQKGTQAIHHLTIGWTPDSLEQRNGRGARQGNMTEKVRIYYYDADGTFDCAKRTMVNKKADWIGDLTNLKGGNAVQISGGMSNEDCDVLIKASGDPEAVRIAQELKAEAERQARTKATRTRQMTNADILTKQQNFLRLNTSSWPMIEAAVIEGWEAYVDRKKKRDAYAKLKNPNAAKEAREKNKVKIAEEKFEKICKKIDASMTFTDKRRRTWEDRPSTTFDFETLCSTIESREEKAIGPATIRDKIEGEDMDYSSKYLATTNEDGPIHKEWVANVKQAENMIESARSAFKEASNLEGGYPPELIDAISEGRAYLLNGILYADKCFVRVNGKLGYVRVAYKRISAYVFDGRSMQRQTSELPIGTESILSSDPSYEECLREAAAQEDAAELAGTYNVRDAAFSSAIPEVANYRTVARTEYFNLKNYSLPHPYFPVAISEGMTIYDSQLPAKVLPEIRKSQSAIVRGFPDNETFGVESGTEVGRIDDIGSFFVNALKNWCQANGKKASLGDFRWAFWTPRYVVRDDLKASMPIEQFREILKNAKANSQIDFLSEVYRAAVNTVNWIELPDTDEDLDDCIPDSFKEEADMAVFNRFTAPRGKTLTPESKVKFELNSWYTGGYYWQMIEKMAFRLNAPYDRVGSSTIITTYAVVQALKREGYDRWGTFTGFAD